MENEYKKNLLRVPNPMMIPDPEIYNEITPDGIVTALCVKTIDSWSGKEYKELEVGKQYIVICLHLNRSNSIVFLKGFDNGFSKGCFDFSVNGVSFPLIQDAQFLWNISQPQFRIRHARSFIYRSATKEWIEALQKERYLGDLIIDRSVLSKPSLPLMPELDINALQQFIPADRLKAEISQRIEFNGIILSLKIRESDGMLCFHKDINIKVVRFFAYLHNRCSRVKDGKETNILYDIRNTLLKDLNDEEFTLLERVCQLQLYTQTSETGNLTIDTCLDAERLELKYIKPEEMATPSGKYYLQYKHKMQYYRELFEVYNLL